MHAYTHVHTHLLFSNLLTSQFLPLLFFCFWQERRDALANQISSGIDGIIEAVRKDDSQSATSVSDASEEQPDHAYETIARTLKEVQTTCAVSTETQLSCTIWKHN